MLSKELDRLVYHLRNNYIANDGQGKLEPTDEREWMGTSSFTPNNENGQLFVSMYYVLMDKLGLIRSIDGFNWIKMAEFTRKPETKGIFYRRRLDDRRFQSHDNLIGLAIGSLLFCSSIKDELREEIYRNKFRWQVTGLEKWYEGIIQGGDCGLLNLVCGRSCNPLFMAWLLVGLLGFKKDAGQLNLARFRIHGLQLANKTYNFGFITRFILNNLEKWFDIRYKDNKKSVREYFGREGLEVPYVKLWEYYYGI